MAGKCDPGPPSPPAAAVRVAHRRGPVGRVTAGTGPQIGYLARLAARAAGSVRLAPLTPSQVPFAGASRQLGRGPEASPGLPFETGLADSPGRPPGTGP